MASSIFGAIFIIVLCGFLLWCCIGLNYKHNHEEEMREITMDHYFKFHDDDI